MKTIQDILTEKGYEAKDNRSYFYKALNKALEYGIDIIVSDKGMVNFTGKGFAWNVGIQHKGWGLKRVWKVAGFKTFNADNIGRQLVHCVGVFQKEAYDRGLTKEETHNVDLKACECVKCSGRGFIPGFFHIANGICFDCMGGKYDWRRVREMQKDTVLK